MKITMNETLIQTLSKALELAHVPGIAVAVVDRQNILFSGGFGVRCLEEPEAIDADTLFGIASNTKAFTASAIGLLVDEGLLDWDAPVLEYLPDFQLFDAEATRQITLRDLLCHRSGLATWGGDLTWYGSIYSMEEVIRRMRYQPPAFGFRSGYGYCNLMFMTAGLVLEKVTGQPFGKFLAERIFNPLGMIRTITSTTELEGMSNVATPHTLLNDTLIPVPYRNTDNNTPAGGVISSVNDLSRWLRLQLNNGVWNDRQILSPATIQATRTSHNLIVRSTEMKQLNPLIHFSEYGLGWQLNDYRGYLMVQHGGALDGMLSMSAFLPEAGIGAVVLTNSDSHLLYSSALFTLLDAALNVENSMDWIERYQAFHDTQEAQKKHQFNMKEQARASSSCPSHSLHGFCGIFNNAIYGDLRVTLDHNELIILPQAHPNIRGTLSHWQYDTFMSTWSEPVWGKSLVHFGLDVDGVVSTLRFRIAPEYLDPLEYVFSRRSEG